MEINPAQHNQIRGQLERRLWVGEIEMKVIFFSGACISAKIVAVAASSEMSMTCAIGHAMEFSAGDGFTREYQPVVGRRRAAERVPTPCLALAPSHLNCAPAGLARG